VILLLGDIHLGNAKSDLPALLELMLRARSPTIEAIALVGDVIDNFGLYQTQALEQLPSPIDAQERLFSWLVKVLKEVGRGGDISIHIAFGNHDRTPAGNLLAIMCRERGVECSDYVLLDNERLLLVHTPYKRSSSAFNNTPLAAVHLLESLMLEKNFRNVRVVAAGHTHSRFTATQLAGRYYIVLPALLEPRGVFGIRPKVAVGIGIYYSDVFLDIVESPGYSYEHRQACLHRLLAELVQGRTPGLEESAELCGVR